MKRALRHSVVFALVVFVTSAAIYAQNTVELLRIIVNERDARVEMAFNALPSNTQSELNPAKDRITITLPNASVDAAFNEPLGKGVIEDIFVRSSAEGLKVFVDLSKRSGFAVSTLPYSNRVQVHMFSWQSLSASDNALYSGMLAQESGVYSAAGEEYQRAVDAGSGTAAAYYGLMLLQQGKLAEAQLMLYKARSLSSDIADVYAGLAEIHGKLGDVDKQRQFQQLFESKTGKQPGTIVQRTDAANVEVVEPQSLATRLDVFDQEQQDILDSTDALAQDAIEEISKEDSAAQVAQEGNRDSTTDRLAHLFDAEGHKLKSERDNPVTAAMPQWLKDMLMLGFALLFVVGIGLVVAYVMWRRKKLARSNVPFANDFAKEMDTALRDLSDVYGKDLSGAEAKQEPEQESETTASDEDKKENDWFEPASADSSEVSNSEEEFILSSLQDTNGSRETSMPKTGTNEEDMRNLSSRLRRGEGELEFSMNMASKREQELMRSLASLDSDSIPESSTERQSYARDKHTESGALDLKKKLSVTGKAKSTFSKLFGDRA